MFARARGLARETAVRFNLMSYATPFGFDRMDWDSAYSTGEHDHYGFINEWPRYGVLQGYIAARGGAAAILDVGCGVGNFRQAVPDALVARFVGIDPSEVAIAQANGNGWARSEFHVGALPGLELGRFDIVVFNEMLYVVDDLDRLFQRTLELLAPDGWVLSSVSRHTGDFLIQQRLDAHFEQVDSVWITSNSVRSKWHVACHANPAAKHPVAARIANNRLR